MSDNVLVQVMTVLRTRLRLMRQRLDAYHASAGAFEEDGSGLRVKKFLSEVHPNVDVDVDVDQTRSGVTALRYGSSPSTGRK